MKMSFLVPNYIILTCLDFSERHLPKLEIIIPKNRYTYLNVPDPGS